MGRQTLGQMDTWADGHLGRWTLGQMDTWADGQMDKWTDRHLGRWINGQTDTWSDGQMDRQTLGKMDKWTNGQMDRNTIGQMDKWAGSFLTCSPAPVASLGTLSPRNLYQPNLILELLSSLLLDFPGQRRRQAAGRRRCSVQDPVVAAPQGSVGPGNVKVVLRQVGRNNVIL
jgi:hypothetical protein